MRVIQKRPEFPRSNMRLSGVCLGGPCNQSGAGMLEDLGSYLDELIPPPKGEGLILPGEGLVLTSDARPRSGIPGEGLVLPGEGLVLTSGIHGEGKSGLLPADELKMELIKQLSRVKKKKRKSKKGTGLDTDLRSPAQRDIATKVLPSIINEIVKMGMTKADAKKLLKTSLAKAQGNEDISKIAMIPLKMLSNDKKLLKSIENEIKRGLSEAERFHSGGSFWGTLKDIAGTVAPFLPLLL
jgi:hypothetical protein